LKFALASVHGAGIIPCLDPQGINDLSVPPSKPMGWLVGLGVLLITLGVVFGLVGIGIVAKRNQAHRIDPKEVQNTEAGSGATNAQ
jgi:hypothetical protein